MQPASFSPVRRVRVVVDAMADATLAAYPGTALTRMENARARAASLTESDLSQDWEAVRGKLLGSNFLRPAPTFIGGEPRPLLQRDESCVALADRSV